MASLRERKYGIQGKTMQSNKNAQHQIQLARICGHEKCISDNDSRASKITKDHCGTDIFNFFHRRKFGPFFRSVIEDACAVRTTAFARAQLKGA
jgi:hypothetical protein